MLPAIHKCGAQPTQGTGTEEATSWVAVDVCRALGVEGNPANIMRDFLPTARGGLYTIQTPGGPQQMLTVTEAGLS